MPLEPGLYVAATPIGNLKDVTFRVIEALKEADRILCEDTRQTAKLCAAYGVTTPRAPYHEHNADKVRPGVIAALREGAAICLVSDAGTPLISDPGYKLVREAREAGVKVFPLPGPSAVMAALSAAGAPTDRFLFAGFAPAKTGARRKFLESLQGVDATIVFFESPARLADCLVDATPIFGDRRIIVARELTKLHEEFVSGAAQELAERWRETAPKGEIVLLVEPPPTARPAGEDDIEEFLVRALATMSVKDAAGAAADALGAPRKRAYDLALAIKARG